LVLSSSLNLFFPVWENKSTNLILLNILAGKEQNDFRAAEHVEPIGQTVLWRMLPIQLGPVSLYDYIGAIDDFAILPRPADYLFLYFLGFMVYY
jgi:hypothetical protein